MIDYNLEFVKGVLFVRLYGILSRFTQNQIEYDISKIIKEGGIKYLVINLEDVQVEDDVSLFEELENLVLSNKGKMILCGEYYERYNYSKDELTALREMIA